MEEVIKLREEENKESFSSEMIVILNKAQSVEDWCLEEAVKLMN